MVQIAATFRRIDFSFKKVSTLVLRVHFGHALEAWRYKHDGWFKRVSTMFSNSCSIVISHSFGSGNVGTTVKGIPAWILVRGRQFKYVVGVNV